MTRREEVEVLDLWNRWSRGKPRTNHTYVDFYFDIVQPHPTLGRINAFEILDAVVNAEAPAPASA